MFQDCGRLFKLGALFALLCTGMYGTPVTSLMCANPGSTKASPNAIGILANSCTDFSYAFPAIQPSTGLNNWQYGYYTGTSTTTPTFNPAAFTLMTSTPTVDANGNSTGGNAGWWSQNFSQYWTSVDAFEAHSNAIYTDLHPSPYCNEAVYGNCGIGYDPRSPNSPGSGDYWATRRYIVPSGFSGLVTVNVSSEKDPRTASPGAMGDVEYIVEVHNGVATTLACLNVPVGGVLNPNVVYPNCGTASTSTDPDSNSTIYSKTVQTTVNAGDFIDLVLVPNYNAAIKTAAATSAGLADFSSGIFQLETLQGFQSPNPPNPPSTPEPATTVLLGGGLAGIIARRGFAARD